MAKREKEDDYNKDLFDATSFPGNLDDFWSVRWDYLKTGRYPSLVYLVK
jgi:hypothetical protein